MKLFNHAEERFFPDSRVLTIDVCELGMKKHHVKGLLEIDVTEARDIFRKLKERDGKSLSFTAWLLKCISVAVCEHKEAHAYIKSKRSILIFDDIDISITVERSYNGYSVPLPYVVRKTNHKSILEIHHEIRQAQQGIIEDGNVVIGQKYNKVSFKFYLALPGWMRRWVWRAYFLKPLLAKKTMGSIVVTSVGMLGSLDGWIIPIGIHPLCFGIGSIVKKPGVVDNTVAIREYLKMTVLLDHDVIDGAPAVRFLSSLDELLRKAYGLAEMLGESPGK